MDRWVGPAGGRPPVAWGARWTYGSSGAQLIRLDEDSQACIKIATNPCLATRTKHFDIKYHRLRQKVEEKAVELKYISTHEQIADLLTKSLATPQHEKLTAALTGI